MNFRPIEPRDIAQILRLNQESVECLSPLDASALDELIELSALALVAESQDSDSAEIWGFVLALVAEAEYASPNYQWFRKEYRDFLYVDRIVVSAEHRTKGVARRIYDYLLGWASEQGLSSLVAEINIQPKNPESLAFHKSFGFAEVGQLRLAENKLVSLQKKNL